jgi:ADP-ribose pyrophosphatase YjhB (NUDIX family)
MSETLTGETTKMLENDFIKNLASLGRKPEAGERPARARAIIINPDGTKFVGILRQRVGSEPYIVFPGGGLEDSDLSVVEGVEREVTEELTDIHPGDVSYVESILEFDNQFYLIGMVESEDIDFVIGGPEKDRDPAQHGTYQPGWYPISEVPRLNVVPQEVSLKLTQTYEQLQP